MFFIVIAVTGFLVTAVAVVIAPWFGASRSVGVVAFLVVVLMHAVTRVVAELALT